MTDIIIFSICNKLLTLGIFASTAIARVISSAVNYILNKEVVFHSHSSTAKSLLKYYALAIPVMLISAFGVKGLCLLLSVPANSFAVTLIKIIVDFILFIINYNLQKKWIFKK